MGRVELPASPSARAEVLREFAGLWIAVIERNGIEEVIGAADTPDGVFRIMDEAREPDAVVSRIPPIRQGLPIGLG